MDIDDPELSESLLGESPEDFRARIGLIRRVLPILRDLIGRRMALVIESERRSSSTVPITSDFVLEFGDIRVRLVLVASDSNPMSSGRIPISSLRHYILDVPDTDAIAVVADDDALSTWVFDVYGLQTDGERAEPMGIGEALDAYFEDIVHPIEIPNFRRVLSLPTKEVLEAALEQDAREAFEKVRRSNARIEEKITALGLLGSAECNNLVNTVLMALRSGKPSLSPLLPDGSSNDH